MLFLCGCILLWTFLEASFWWVAPDISICIAIAYFPKRWRLFLFIGLLGSLLGSLLTYFWASSSAEGWLAYIADLRFHSNKNIEYVTQTLPHNYFSILTGAWLGIPYKMFIGIGAIQGISFYKLGFLGLTSRTLRFSFSLIVSVLIRKFSKPWSVNHPTQFALVLLSIWAAMILLFDRVINYFV